MRVSPRRTTISERNSDSTRNGHWASFTSIPPQQALYISPGLFTYTPIPRRVIQASTPFDVSVVSPLSFDYPPLIKTIAYHLLRPLTPSVRPATLFTIQLCLFTLYALMPHALDMLDRVVFPTCSQTPVLSKPLITMTCP